MGTVNHNKLITSEVHSRNKLPFPSAEAET